jgi:hypothetical protein
VRYAALDNGKTEQIKAIKVNALLFESGKRCSIRFPHAFPSAATDPDIVRSAALHWNGPTAG